MQFEYNPNKYNKSIPEEPQQQQKQHRIVKQWKIAPRHHMGKNVTGINWTLESHFMRIRKEVRKLYAQHHEYFYDRDYRNDKADPCTMHIFACSTLYMSLDCSYFYEYYIEYHIEDSPFKEIITALLRTAGKPKLIEPNMSAHFEHMRRYYNDDPQYFSYLRPEDDQQA
jgi:hypothetical protein